MRLVKKIGLFFAIALVTVCVGLIGYRVRRPRRFNYSAAALSDADYVRLASKPGWQPRSIDVGGGVVLRGLEKPAAGKNQPWLLLFEGNSGKLLDDGQRLLSALLKGRKWGGAIYAYRGFDASSGTPSPEALADDGCRALIELMQEHQLSSDRVHLVAFSLGTTIVAAIAARTREHPPATVTLLAPATELDAVRGPIRHRYETLKYLGAIESPTLIVHGRLDETLPVEGGRRIAAELGPRATYFEHPDLGHNDLHESQAVIDEVCAFVERHVKEAID